MVIADPVFSLVIYGAWNGAILFLVLALFLSFMRSEKRASSRSSVGDGIRKTSSDTFESCIGFWWFGAMAAAIIANIVVDQAHSPTIQSRRTLPFSMALPIFLLACMPASICYYSSLQRAFPINVGSESSQSATLRGRRVIAAIQFCWCTLYMATMASTGGGSLLFLIAIGVVVYIALSGRISHRSLRSADAYATDESFRATPLFAEMTRVAEHSVRLKHPIVTCSKADMGAAETQELTRGRADDAILRGPIFSREAVRRIPRELFLTMLAYRYYGKRRRGWLDPLHRRAKLERLDETGSVVLLVTLGFLLLMTAAILYSGGGLRYPLALQVILISIGLAGLTLLSLGVAAATLASDHALPIPAESVQDDTQEANATTRFLIGAWRDFNQLFPQEQVSLSEFLCRIQAYREFLPSPPSDDLESVPMLERQLFSSVFTADRITLLAARVLALVPSEDYTPRLEVFAQGLSPITEPLNDPGSGDCVRG